MTTRPLILHHHEVRAALDGRLGLIVRPVKPQPEYQDATGRWTFCVSSTDKNSRDKWSYCVIDDNGHHYTKRGRERCVLSMRDPFGVPGGRLRCKEAWKLVPASAYAASTDDGVNKIPHRVNPGGYGWAIYREGWSRSRPGAWVSPATMPAWASRITLEVEGVRCVRPTGLTEQEAITCGFSWTGEPGQYGDGCQSPFSNLEDFWTAKYAPRYPWETSWAWAVGVRRVEG